MATLDAMRTPPPASLSAMLSHQSVHDLCALYPTSMTSEINSILDTKSFDDLSSSDKENSPSYAPHKQKRANSASPTMKALSHSSPAKQYMSFTPQRVRPPPRAWERRPATPFVARTEGQKIWKRVPLQDLGSDVNQQISRREKEERENYLRVTKRLCLDIQMDANVVSNPEHNPARVAIGTKWEEEHIEKEGSPKKKLRQPDNTMHKDIIDAPIDQNSSRKQDNIQTTEDEVLLVNNTIQILDQSSAQVPSNSDRDQSKEKSVETTAVNTEAALESVPSINELDETASAAKLLTENDDIIDPTFEQDAQDTEGAEVIPTDAAANTSDTRTNERPCEDASIATSNVETLDLETQPDAKEPVTVTTSTEAKLSSDHDETAFLRDFLERAQASKALKIALSPQKKTIPALQPILEGVQLEPAEVVDEIEDDDLPHSTETAQIEEALVIDASTLVSPIRRSARTASRISSSRLPRYQAPSASHLSLTLPSQHVTTSLPGTIQLKRATGNEFIFNARSQQTLAMTTRSNTKQNQNGAIQVSQRLAQLRKELEVRQQNEAAAALPVSEISEVAGDTAKSTTKKRKRDKQDESRPRKSRNVRWPTDDQLASYREPIPYPTDSDDSDTSAENPPQLPPTSEEAQTEKTPDPTNTDQAPNPKSSNTHKKPESNEDTSKLKVRRIRKIKLDSVNGTPAPKTRSRSVSNLTSEQNSEQFTFSIAQPVLSTTRRSSRMPVPVSTPIPLPTSAVSESKAKSSSTDKENRKSPHSAVKSTTEARGAKEAREVSQTTESERKLTGARKLRGRP